MFVKIFGDELLKGCNLLICRLTYLRPGRLSCVKLCQVQGPWSCLFGQHLEACLDRARVCCPAHTKVLDTRAGANQERLGLKPCTQFVFCRCKKYIRKGQKYIYVEKILTKKDGCQPPPFVNLTTWHFEIFYSSSAVLPSDERPLSLLPVALGAMSYEEARAKWVCSVLYPWSL